MIEHRIKNATDHVPAILDGSKTGTVRYGNERDIRPGHVLALEDADSGEVIARRTVEHAVPTAVCSAIDLLEALGARYTIATTPELLETLNHYYDDDPIRLWSPVEAIVYEGPHGDSPAGKRRSMGDGGSNGVIR